ncbi:hypothetical protein MKX01_032734, partial [Papaver californicum]
ERNDRIEYTKIHNGNILRVKKSINFSNPTFLDSIPKNTIKLNLKNRNRKLLVVKPQVVFRQEQTLDSMIRKALVDHQEKKLNKEKPQRFQASMMDVTVF